MPWAMNLTRCVHRSDLRVSKRSTRMHHTQEVRAPNPASEFGRHRKHRQQTPNRSRSRTDKQGTPRNPSNQKRGCGLPRHNTHLTASSPQKARSKGAKRRTSYLDMKTGREGKNAAPTHSINNRVLPLHIKWVLISTIALCVYTLHNASSSILHSTIYPQSCHPPIATPKISPPKCLLPTPSRSPQAGHAPIPTPSSMDLPSIPIHPLMNLLSTPTYSKHSSCHHKWPPPQHRDAPLATMSPPPPTKHNSTHKGVSKTTCYYQTISHAKTNQQITHTLPTNLPLGMQDRHSPPPHTAKGHLHPHLDPIKHTKQRQCGQLNLKKESAQLRYMQRRYTNLNLPTIRTNLHYPHTYNTDRNHQKYKTRHQISQTNKHRQDPSPLIAVSTNNQPLPQLSLQIPLHSPPLITQFSHPKLLPHMAPINTASPTNQTRALGEPS